MDDHAFYLALLRAIERLLAMLMGGLAIYLGYFISGCLGLIYCTSHSHEQAPLLFDLLHNRTFVDFFPFEKYDFPTVYTMAGIAVFNLNRPSKDSHNSHSCVPGLCPGRNKVYFWPNPVHLMTD